MEKIRLDVVISFPSLVRRFPSVSNSVLCSFLSHLWSSFIKLDNTPRVAAGFILVMTLIALSFFSRETV
jgi:hypothetical protein